MNKVSSCSVFLMLLILICSAAFAESNPTDAGVSLPVSEIVQTDISEQQTVPTATPDGAYRHLQLAELSSEELMKLRDEIDVLLEQRGISVFYDIERGNKGADVSRIQERLSQLGYYTGKMTGKFDTETQKAFKAFEKAHNLKSDGLASREDQIVLFSSAAIAKATPTPIAYQTPAAGKDSSSEHDSSFNYEDCLRNPSLHQGEAYKLKGRVEQTMGNRTNGFQIRFSVLGNTDEIIYVYIQEDPGYNILENDWLIIDLIMFGTITYESIWGQEVTIPLAFASNVVLR